MVSLLDLPSFTSIERRAMDHRSYYHQGSRQLQDEFDSRRIADRLEAVTLHHSLTEGDKAFLARASMFFLASVDPDGYPDCSYKGGLPGFVRPITDTQIAFPDYDGNGMFRSLGNVLLNPHVGLLFIDFEHPDRMRINGSATVHTEDPLLDEYPGARMIVRVEDLVIFPNCPRYIHTMRLERYSVYAPRYGYEPPTPDWKNQSEFRDALPREGLAGRKDNRGEAGHG
jgi:predicted pyridoxine 5'-phosphate oxidase superfamily flavin-nucleotide-binding protein